MSDNPDKGLANGSCNRRACQAPLSGEPVHQFMEGIFTGGPRLHYCAGCAADFDAWDLRSGDAVRITREAKTASPPSDQPADHIGEGKTFEQIKALIEADEAGRLSVSDLRTLLSLIARQQETIRADGEALEKLLPAMEWADAHTGGHTKYESAQQVVNCLDAHDDALAGLRARLSARTGGA